MVHILARIILWTVAILSALAIFSVQMSMPPLYMLIGLLIPGILIYPLHCIDPKTYPGQNGYAITPFSFNCYMGRYASELMQPLIYALLVINVLWALRWLFGVEFISANLYGLNATILESLYNCAAAHPYIEGPQTCNVLASFLDHPWAVYTHAIGAISCLIIGPFQLNGKIRSLMNHKLHRCLGYSYLFFTLMGTAGALALMLKTTSGVTAGLGFFFLAIAWNFSLFKGVTYARAKNITMHREWMIRNYFYTFSAIPFRFLPGIFLAFGVPPESNVAYPVGTWLTLLLTTIVSEKFLEITRNPKTTTLAERADSIERGSTLQKTNPLDVA